MPLSTSSSNRLDQKAKKAIRFGLFVVLALIGIHSLYILGPGSNLYKAEDQRSDNINRLEEFVFEDSGREINVVVGTSLSANVEHEDLVNLSMRGGSTATALQAISCSPAKVATVLVEANLLFKPADPEIVKWLSPAKKHFPILQNRYRPIGLILGVVHKIQGVERDFTNVPSASSIVQDVKAQKLESVIRRASQSIEDEQVARFRNVIWRSISDLEAGGTQVILYWTPFDSKVASQPLHKDWRKRLDQLLPERKIHDIMLSNPTTSDGIHLCREGVMELGEKLAQLVNGESKEEAPSK